MVSQLDSSVKAETAWSKKRVENSSYMAEAQYRTDEKNPLFASNQAITCLPAVPSEIEAQEFLCREPGGRTAEFFDMPLEVRIEHATQVREVFVPTSEHIAGLSDMFKVIRSYYGRACIGQPQFMNHLHRTCLSTIPVEVPQIGRYQGSSGGIVLVGPTGVGKSCLVDQLQAFIRKPVFVHRSMYGMPCCWPQVTILRVSAAGRTTHKTLALAIARKIDNLLEDPDKKAERAIMRSTDYVTQLACLLVSNLVALLIVEDVQLWARVHKQIKIAMLNLLVGVQEESRVPVMCVGTMLLKDVLETNLSQTDKLMAEGQIILNPVLDIEDMHNLCYKFWQYRVASGSEVPPDWLPVEMILHTAGIRRYARELIVCLFKMMAIDEVEVLERKYFRSVANQALQHAKPAIEILRRAYRGKVVDRHQLQKYEEFIGIDEYRAAVHERAISLNVHRRG